MGQSAFDAGVEGFETRAFRGCGVVTSDPFEVSDGARGHENTRTREHDNDTRRVCRCSPQLNLSLGLQCVLPCCATNRPGGRPDAAALHAGWRVLRHRPDC